MTKLYRKNSVGMGTWQIDVQGNALHYGHSIVEGGAIVWHVDNIELNNSGRTIEQQIQLEMDSRINRMLNKGYKRTREEAEAGPTNQMGLKQPMLAQSIDKVGAFVLDGNSRMQPKLDGHRCLISNVDGLIMAYTRQGKPTESIPHILQQFSWLPEGKTVDGELYLHGKSLQQLSSLIKRTQAGSAELMYHWYDYMSDLPFHQRSASMAKAHSVHGATMPNVQLVETLTPIDMGDVYVIFRRHREAGYEGSMLRLATSGYQDGKRSNQLLKVKERHDCEVTVIGGRPSKEGWAVLRVKTDWGAELDISAPGSVPEKLAVMKDLTSYIGRRLTIEYAMKTADHVPFHAVATRWYEEI
jgi:DNA ligase-1